tara:strand:- start:2473 stop:3780 length:1308 start_codon:yes stop_codon:yes gene_type:complete
MPKSIILKGQVLAFKDDPFAVDLDDAVSHEVSGAVWIEDGFIRSTNRADTLIAEAEDVPVYDYGDSLIVAGFIDCHSHYPQLPIIASYGEQLLEWLEKYTFPREAAYSDSGIAKEAAEFFLEENLRNGITTSSVYATVHPESVDAFFEAASMRNLRMACGKVLMNRNAPKNLTDTVQSGYDDTKNLIERWHGKGRNIYAITPRFAITSTPEQLESAGALWSEYPDVLMQTHLSENHDELQWVAELFPNEKDYFHVYEKYGLTGPGAIFGHAIHLKEREREAIYNSGSAIAHCPTSNTFIGSGLFDMKGLRGGLRPINTGLATDVAGGSSLSMLATMRTAYEIAQLQGYSLHPLKNWYLASVGAAKTMHIEDRVGNIAPGMEADITIIDLKSTPLIARRVSQAENFWDILFAQIILGDDRAIKATYVFGELVYESH